MRRHVLAVAGLLLAGCFTRDTVSPRFFYPEAATLGAPADPPPGATAGAPIRLRPVHEAGFLRERIVWRVSEVEYGRYEQWRWNELPAQYVEHAVAHTLQAKGGLALTDDVAAPALGLDVLAFDEVLAPTHVARIVLRASLREPKRGTLLDRQFLVEAPVTESTPTAVARAMGRALDEIAAQVTEAVASRIVPVGGRRGASK
jgi:ABC-type uncharacterized transport system auxiliary subunit